MKHFTLLFMLTMLILSAVRADVPTPPVALCKDITVSVDEYGYVSIIPDYIDNGSYDEESGIAGMELSISEFNCENLWGENIVTLTVTNNLLLTSECQSTVTVIDDLAPVEVYCQDIEIQIISNGTASLEPWQLEAGSFDNCGINYVEASKTEFNCEDLGENVVEVTIYDHAGNYSTCNSTVTVIDTILAEAVCLGDLIRHLENGSLSISLMDINEEYSSCNILSSTLSQTYFTCADTGMVEVVLTVVDINNNETSCITELYIVDNEHACNVDCEVSEWSEWSDCTESCGGGIQTRIRTITTAASNGGAECGELTEIRACNEQGCPVDCEVGEWSEWSDCTESCGGGIQTRTRTITAAASNGGAECGELTETRACNVEGCPVNCEVSEWSEWSDCTESCGGGIQTRTRTITTAASNGGAECGELTEIRACNEQGCPVDCEVGEWSEWSDCTVSCGGGIQTRTRTVITAAFNGGSECGELTETRACNEQGCPVDCEVGEWSEWSHCTESCGGGIQTRTRTVITAASNGGAECGELTETRACNEQGCPVDCEVGEWSEWSHCTESCGGGIQTRTRTITTAASNGGAECGELTETRACNEQGCPVDCEVGEWSEWSHCTESCGGGIQTRTRTVITAASSGGAECGELTETRACNEQGCPVDCEVGEWSEWSHCTESCGGGIQTRTRTVITAASNGGAECGELTETRACNEQGCPVDCEIGEWSEWSHCTESCGGGIQTRTRTVIIAASNGGAECGELTETRACNEQGCPVDCEVSEWSQWSDCTVSCGSGIQTRTRTVITPASNGGVECGELKEIRGCNDQSCSGCQTAPAKPKKIYGKKPKVCPGSTSEYYIDPVPGAVEYIWTVSNGVKIINGNGTTHITISFPEREMVHIELWVSAVNKCGTSPAKNYGGISLKNKNCSSNRLNAGNTLPDVSGDFDIMVYPNPGSGNITLQLNDFEEEEKVIVRVLDMRGLVYLSGTFDLSNNTVGLNTQDLPKGIYLIEAGTLQKRKVIKFVKY